jgi:C4-dicarboxylate transporter DctQ subunit
MLTGRVNRGLEASATGISLMLGVALMVAVVINVINVIGRYGFNHPIEGADEVEVYLMVGLAFLGALVAHTRRRHLRMDVLARRFPPRVARAVNMAEALVAVGVCGLMTWVSFNYTSRIWRLGSHSENAHIQMWIPHSILAIAFALMTVVGVIRLFVAPPPPAVDHPELSV